MRLVQQNKSVLWPAVLVYYAVASIGAAALGILQSLSAIPGVVIQLAQFGPALGVLAVGLLRFRLRLPMPEFRMTWRSVPPKKLLAAVGLTLLIFAGAWSAYILIDQPVSYTPPASLSHPFWLIAIAQFIGAAGEEIGWRCYLQPTLQDRIGVLPASVIVGLLWGVWHIGIFAEGWGYASLFVLFAVALSVMLGELLRDAKSGQLFLSAGLHALVNLGLLLSFDEENGSLIAIGTLAASCTIFAIAFVLFGRASRRR